MCYSCVPSSSMLFSLKKDYLADLKFEISHSVCVWNTTCENNLYCWSRFRFLLIKRFSVVHQWKLVASRCIILWVQFSGTILGQHNFKRDNYNILAAEEHIFTFSFDYCMNENYELHILVVVCFAMGRSLHLVISTTIYFIKWVLDSKDSTTIQTYELMITCVRMYMQSRIFTALCIWFGMSVWALPSCNTHISISVSLAPVYLACRFPILDRDLIDCIRGQVTSHLHSTG